MTLDALFDQYEAARKAGEPKQEVAVLRQMLSLAQQFYPEQVQVYLHLALGNALQEMGELKKSHVHREAAMMLVEKLGAECPPELGMRVKGDLGRSYIEAHDWARAELYTNAALSEAVAAGEETAQCVFRTNLGLIYANTDRPAEARRLSEENLRIAERSDNHYVITLEHINLAGYLRGEARLNESLKHARLALSHAARSGDQGLRVRARQQLGETLSMASMITGRQDYLSDAEHYLKEVAHEAHRRGDSILEAHTETGLAQGFEHHRQFDAAGAHYRQALSLLESVRVGLGYEEFQLSHFRNLESLYEQIIEFLLRRGQTDPAFLTAEQSRSRVLLSLLNQKQFQPRDWSEGEGGLRAVLLKYGAEVDELAAERALADAAWRASGGNGRAVSPPQIHPTSEALDGARRAFRELYESQRLRRAGGRRPQPRPVVEAPEAQRSLEGDEALLSYFVTGKGIVAFALTSEGCHFQHLYYPRREVEADVRELQGAMLTVQDAALRDEWMSARTDAAHWPDAVARTMPRLRRILEKVYALLVAPLLPVVAEKRHWVIVPHGQLHFVPWAALWTGERYLIERHSVSILPSASMLPIIKSREVPAGGEAVFFANPEPDSRLWMLPGAVKEVKACQDAFGEKIKLFVGGEAVKSDFFASTATAQLMHLACHHAFDSDTPLLSFLKLAGGGADSLYAFEVRDLNLHTQLVSLSACESGLSGIVTGDEQMGMVRAFLESGVSSVISTIWSLDDDSPPEFFVQFYRRAQVSNLGQALAETQREMLRHPRYLLPPFWAPYLLSGQWHHPLNLTKS